MDILTYLATTVVEEEVTADDVAHVNGIVIGLAAAQLIGALIGLALILVPIMVKKSKKKRCSVEVEATVVELVGLGEASHFDSGEEAQAQPTAGMADDPQFSGYRSPVYEATVNGQLIHIKSNTYSSMVTEQIGDKKILCVNPDNPTKDFYDKAKKSNLITIACVLMGIITFISCIYSFAAMTFLSGSIQKSYTQDSSLTNQE